MKPTKFIIGGKKYYLTDMINIVDSTLDSNFFEFFVKNAGDYEPDKILVWADDSNGRKRSWAWFIYLKRDGPIYGISYHYKNNIIPEKDVALFLRYVRRKTPDAIPHILFNYII